MCPLPLRERATRCCRISFLAKPPPHPFFVGEILSCPLPRGERANAARVQCCRPRERSARITTREFEEHAHEPGHPRALLRRAWTVELLAGLGAAGAGDVGVAKAEVQARRLAFRRGKSGA